MARKKRILESGEILESDEGVRYLVDEQIGEGGFGQTYRAFKLSRTGSKRVATVCLKVCASIYDWHGEAFFGRLLHGRTGAVHLLDSFVASTDRDRVRWHVLIFEFIDEGTVWEACSNRQLPWNEAKVRTEVARILGLLAEMHNVGITHRDITPGNVFLRKGHLALGDFGISRMTLNPKEATITAFTPDYVPQSVWRQDRWGPAEDLYQLGLLTCTLLTGEVWDNGRIRDLKSLDAADDLKCWIWHATAAKAKKYESAAAAFDALKTLKNVDLDNGRMPKSLRGEKVVITGSLETLVQPKAAQLLRRAGATVQDAVADSTTLVVRGTVRNGLNYDVGRKLFAVRERKRVGQRITVVSAYQLERWLSKH